MNENDTTRQGRYCRQYPEQSIPDTSEIKRNEDFEFEIFLMITLTLYINQFCGSGFFSHPDPDPHPERAKHQPKINQKFLEKISAKKSDL